MSYTNADGLYVRTFDDQGATKDNGIVLAGERHQLVLTVTGTEVPSSAATPEPDDAFLPANAYITSAYTVVEEAFTSGGSATLTVGLFEADGTTIDADGIDAAVALSAVNAVGKAVVNDGALVGGTATVGTANAYVEPVYGTAAFTGGKAKVVIEYILV